MATVVKLTRFHKDAIDLFESNMQSHELRSREYDRSKEIFAFMKNWINIKKQLMSIQILGQVVSGKSTLAFVLVKYIQEKCLKKNLTMKNLCPNQITFERRIKNKESVHECYQIDEWNPASETGYGASTEAKSLEAMNKITAQNFNHRVSCSPDTLKDTSVVLILETLPMDREKKLCNAMVRFRFLYEGLWHEQTIGFVSIYVGDILNDSLYKLYIKQKFAFINLMREYNIDDERKFDEAKLIMETYKRYDKVAKLGLIPNRGMIELTMNHLIDDRVVRLNTSIIQLDALAKRVQGMLESLKKISILKKQLDKLNKENVNFKQKTGKKNPEIEENIETIIEALEQSGTEMMAIEKKFTDTIKLGEDFWEDVQEQNITLKIID